MTSPTTGPAAPDHLIPARHLLHTFAAPCLLLDREGATLQSNAAARAHEPPVWPGRAPDNWPELRASAPDYPESVPVSATETDQRPEMRLSRIRTDGPPVYLLHAPAQERQFVGLLARTSHDIRTELQTIVAANDLLRDTRPLSAAETRNLQDNIEHAARRALELTDAALDLAKGEYRRLEPAESVFSPSRRIAATVQRLTSLARANGNELVVKSPATPVTVFGRADLIDTIAQNLLGNAIKFTQNGTIRVTIGEATQPDGANCDFTVEFEDTGIGIPEHEQTRILAPFQTGDIQDAAWRGTGIGTYIVQKSLDDIGGTLHLQSAPGEGSRFTVRFSLPLAELPAQPVRPAEQPLSGTRLLIVEDNDTNRTLFLRTLRSAGATVDTASGGTEALERLQDGGPAYDLVLLDLTMPGFDGLALACRLLRSVPAKPPRIAAISGQADLDDAPGYAALGISEIVQKPVRPRDLVQRVRAMLSGAPGADTSPLPDLLNTALIEELREDLGRETTDNLLRRAADEAAALHQLLSAEDTETSPREPIHSALGSSGMTGLARIEHALRVVQTVSRTRPPGSDAMREALRVLQAAIRDTTNALP